MRASFARLAALCALVPALVSAQALPETTSARPLPSAARLAVFRAPGFPTIDAQPIAASTLERALAGLPATVFDSPEALASGLSLAQAEVLLLPNGSAFPLEAWPAIRGFVKAGGGLVVLGGAPFEQPVLRLAARGRRDARLRPRHAPAELRPRLADRPGRPRRRRLYRGAAPHRTRRRLGLGGHAAPARARFRAHRPTRHAQGPAERGRLRGLARRRAAAAGPRPRPRRAAASLPADEHRPAARRGRRRALGARPLGRGARRGRDPAGDAQGPGGRRAARGAAAAGLGRARRDPRDPRAGVPAGAARGRGRSGAGARSRHRRAGQHRLRGRARARRSCGAPDRIAAAGDATAAAAGPLPRERLAARAPGTRGRPRPASGSRTSACCARLRGCRCRATSCARTAR